MEQKTYTKRTNARRAALLAGVPRELVEISVHKLPEGVRFGWKVGEKQTPAMPKMPSQNVTLRAGELERNGIKRPKAGGVCAAVWDWLDANPDVALKEVKVAACGHGWNVNNVVSEFYQWRRFIGIHKR